MEFWGRNRREAPSSFKLPSIEILPPGLERTGCVPIYHRCGGHSRVLDSLGVWDKERKSWPGIIIIRGCAMRCTRLLRADIGGRCLPGWSRPGDVLFFDTTAGGQTLAGWAGNHYPAGVGWDWSRNGRNGGGPAGWTSYQKLGPLFALRSASRNSRSFCTAVPTLPDQAAGGMDPEGFGRVSAIS